MTARNFDASNFARLASLHKTVAQNTPSYNPIIPRTLLRLGVLLDDPSAIIADAKRTLASTRTLEQLTPTPAWRKLTTLASTNNAAEAHELIATAYTQFKDAHRARTAWLKAAEAGSGLACSVLGGDAFMTPQNPHPTAAKEDPKVKAIEWYKKAAERGEIDGYLRLGELLLDSEPAETEHSLLVAAASGSFLAAGKLEELYRSRGDQLMADSWKEVVETIAAEEVEAPKITEHRSNYHPVRSHKRR